MVGIRIIGKAVEPFAVEIQSSCSGERCGAKNEQEAGPKSCGEDLKAESRLNGRTALAAHASRTARGARLALVPILWHRSLWTMRRISTLANNAAASTIMKRIRPDTPFELLPCGA